MTRGLAKCCLILAGLTTGDRLANTQNDDPGKAAEMRAVEFLTREVPAWSKNNGCFSCHNNGDAARAVYKAGQKGYRIPAEVLADTTKWLAQPQLWKNKGDLGPNDQRLANLQFSMALLTALETGHLFDRETLQVAARKVAADQDASGAWLTDSSSAVGSPATWGNALSTTLACQLLKTAAPVEHMKPLDRAEQWLRRTPVSSVSVAAAVLLAASHSLGSSDKDRTKLCLTTLLGSQTQDGGWGPYTDSPPEVFDTAVVLLALASNGRLNGVTDSIRRGRRFLATQQSQDGGWPATTRPPGGESYAQRLSTTGWATLALLGTRE